VNIPFLGWVKDEHVFSDEETSLILNSTPPNRLPSETARKLEQVDMLEYSEMLGRNLRVLLARRELQAPMVDEGSLKAPRS